MMKKSWNESLDVLKVLPTLIIKPSWVVDVIIDCFVYKYTKRMDMFKNSTFYKYKVHIKIYVSQIWNYIP